MQWKKVLIAVAVFCSAAASVPVSASTTTDKSLGLYEYSWFVDGLESYVFQNPYYASKYKNTVFAERVGAVDGENMGGGYFSPLSWLTVGLYLGNPVNDTVWNSSDRESLFNVENYSVKGKQKSTVHPSKAALQAFTGYQCETLDNKIIDLKDPLKGSATVGESTTSPSYRESLDQQNFNMISSVDFGRWGVGADFGYATSWKNNKTGDETSSSSDQYDFVNTQYSLNLGGYYKINEKVDIDGGMTYVSYLLCNSYKKRTTTLNNKMTYQSDGAMDLGFNTRVNYQMLANHRMHFNFAYMYMNRSTMGQMTVVDSSASSHNVDGKDTFSRTGHNIQLGVSDEFRISQDVKAFVGFNTEIELFSNAYSGKDAIQPAYNLDKYSRDTTLIRVPIIVGMESKLSDNWTGRFGLIQKIYQPVNDSGKNITSMGATSLPASSSDNSSSSTVVNIGLSYKMGNFVFDWLASSDLLVSGPYFISGKTWSASSPTPMSTAFSVTYNFDSFASSALSQEAPKAEASRQTAAPVRR